jgi:hypothetical protein
MFNVSAISNNSRYIVTIGEQPNATMQRRTRAFQQPAPEQLSCLI